MSDDDRRDEGVMPSGYTGVDDPDGYEPGHDGYEDAGGYEEPGYYEEPGEPDGYETRSGYGRRGGGTGTRSARRGRRRMSRRRRQVRSLILLVLLIVIVVAAAGLLWAQRQISPGGGLGRQVTVVVPEGSTSSPISRILSKDGVIHDAGLFRLYVRIEGSGPFKAGTYRMATNESYSRAVGVLEAGPPIAVDSLVIPEGFTLEEIAARAAALPGMRFTAASFLALSSSGAVRSPYEPAHVDDLEGLVFPATYQVSSGESAAQLLTLLVQTFDQRASSLGLQQAAARLHMTPYQVVTVASIVQGEAKLDSQRPDVASVIYNRLATGTPLGADSTLIYALRQANPDLDVNNVNYEQPSPYNTRLHAGLPPTPIDNPGLPSLSAAAAPPHTSYQYFVEINPDGQLGFASTNAGFQELTSECQAAKLC